jgi:ABC-type glycerol-3-phosphate transport system substrate-binding protein
MAARVARTRRSVLGRLAGGAAGLLVAACGPLGTGAREPGAPAPGTRVTVGFLTPAGSWDEALEQYLPRWHEQHPAIEIDWTAGRPFPDVVVTQAAGGTLPDVVYY